MERMTNRPTPSRKQAGIGPELRDRVIEALASSRASFDDVARRFGLSPSRVGQIARANGFSAIGRGA
jgi:transposase-like protein